MSCEVEEMAKCSNTKMVWVSQSEMSRRIYKSGIDTECERTTL